MGYPSLPSARRMHYEIDGTVVGYNTTGNAGDGIVTTLNAAAMLALNEETPTAGDTTLFSVGGGNGDWIYFLFPEAVDVSYIIARVTSPILGASISVEGSTDTTTGADGTWNACSGGTGALVVTSTTDWWRADAPVALMTHNTGLKGLRVNVKQNLQSGPFKNILLWGAKHAGETADDIIFLESDGTTEWPNDDDWGDVVAGQGAITHTYYVKNTSASKTANTITVKVSGSDSAEWTVSLDNSTFASSQAIASLAHGATQVVYVKFAPPAAAGGVYRPYAYYLEADVASWT